MERLRARKFNHPMPLCSHTPLRLGFQCDKLIEDRRDLFHVRIREVLGHAHPEGTAHDELGYGKRAAVLIGKLTGESYLRVIRNAQRCLRRGEHGLPQDIARKEQARTHAVRFKVLHRFVAGERSVFAHRDEKAEPGAFAAAVGFRQDEPLREIL